MPQVDPELEVAGIGAIKLPLKPALAKQLAAACKVAPYGKGTKTLVDRNVRNTFELDPRKFQLSEAWNEALTTVTRQVAEQLGLPADRLEARLYKLLLYERGGFFLSHRDSEKLDRMVASLVVVLPSQFSGGELVVRHESAEEIFRPEKVASTSSCSYIAFYADCEHEVKRVTRGRRICLTYNLVLKPKPRSRKADAQGSSAAAEDALATSIGGWIAARPGEPIVFALEHQYTQAGLAVDLLKGVDRQTAKLIVAAAEQTHCQVHLAQVSRHLLQFADDGSYGRRYRRSHDVTAEDLDIGETYEDDLIADQWKDAQGKSRSIGAIPLDTSVIVSSTPLEDWTPTSEEYEGYTGNEGNTLDRWYHRSAIVIWHTDHHFDILARGEPQQSVNVLLSMIKQLGTTPKKRFEQARVDCLRLAQAIIRQWLQRPHHDYLLWNCDERPWLTDLAQGLLKLEDPDTIAGFLSMLAKRDRTLRLDKFVLPACKKFGTDVFASQLEELLANSLNRFDLGLAPRDAEWLAALSADRKLAARDLELLQRLCTLATTRFCEAYSTEGHSYRGASIASKAVLPLLIRALVAVRADQALSGLIEKIRSLPKLFSHETAQVPCLLALIPWSTKREGSAHPLLIEWLAGVRQELQLATASEPSPSTTWSRPAEVQCTCKCCLELNAFLADPEKQETRIAAREDLRYHVIDSIRRYQCDVTHRLERKGSPYSLVLNKTDGSYKRAVQEFEANVKLLKSLPPAD